MPALSAERPQAAPPRVRRQSVFGGRAPCADLGQHWACQRLAEVRFGLVCCNQLVAACDLNAGSACRPYSLASSAEIENHWRSKARDSRNALLSCLPDDTVEAWSTAMSSPCHGTIWLSGFRANTTLGCDVHQHFAAFLVQLGVTAIRTRSVPGWMRAAALQIARGTAINRCPAVNGEHADPLALSSTGSGRPSVAGTAGAAASSRSPSRAVPACRRARTHHVLQLSTSPHRRCRARRPRDPQVVERTTSLR